MATYNEKTKQLKTALCAVLFLFSITLNASCPDTTPWTPPVRLSDICHATSNIFSAATSAGFMAVWADTVQKAHYSFSSDGITWNGGLITPAANNVATNSDIFVAGNSTGFIVTWMDGDNNPWSSFTADNGATWSNALQINTTLTLNSNSDVFVGGSETGFVATMIGADNNAYVTFSTGTQAWDLPTQVTSDGSVYDQNWNSKTTRGFVCVAVAENSCMLTWITQPLATRSAYFASINPFSTTTVYPIVDIGFFESVPVVAERNGYFMATSRANINDGVSVFSTATTPSNWSILFSLFSSPINTLAGSWVAANQTGFMATWVVGANQNDPGSPVWTFSSDNGFSWTPVCPILATESTTITGPVGLSANSKGFVATWLDSNDNNTYASFYGTPASTSSFDIFVTLLQEKYGPLLSTL